MAWRRAGWDSVRARWVIFGVPRSARIWWQDRMAKVSVTVDIVLFTIREGKLQVLLVKRKIEPFRGRMAIPGGFVLDDESLEEAAWRELREETGVGHVYLEQLYTFGDPDRDPRGRVVTVAYYALVASDSLALMAGTDAAEASWFAVDALPS